MTCNSHVVLKKKSFLIFLILGILTPLLESNSLATNQHQWAAAYLSWGDINSRMSFANTKEFSQNITIHEISDDIFWATQWNSRSVTAYGGIQSTGNLNFDGIGQKIAIFSVWDAKVARTPSGSVCKPFDGEGVGYSCRRPFDFVHGLTLSMKFRLVEDEIGSWLMMDIKFEPAGESISIGQILYPHSNPNFYNIGNFIEYYGSARKCDDVPLGSATFDPPISPVAGALKFEAFRLPNPDVACIRAAADSPPRGQAGNVTLRFGGRDLSPSMTTTTTTTTTVATQIPKIGGACRPLNSKNRVGGKKVTCRVVKKKLIWVKA